MNERRRAPRHPVAGDVFGRVKSTVPARIVDISPFGAQVEITSALRPAVECDVWLPTDEGQIKVRATVHRCRAAGLRSDGGSGSEMVFRAGLEFKGLSAGERDLLARSYPGPAAVLASGASAATARRGPIKIRLDVAHVRRRLDGSGSE